MIHYVSFEPTEYATYGNLKNRIGELLETLGSPTGSSITWPRRRYCTKRSRPD